MELCKPLLLVLMISLGCQISAAEYNVKSFIEDIDFFVPIPGDMISKGLKAYESFNKILDALNGAPTEASVNKQLKDIKHDTKKILDQGYKTEEKVDRLKELIPQQVQIDIQIREIFVKILKIDLAFDDFVRDVLNPRLENLTLNDMANRFVRGGSSERIESQLNDIRVQLESSKTRLALLNLLKDNKQTNEMMCTSKQSPMHLLNVLHNDIVKTEIKGLIIAMWSYSQLRNETILFEGEKERYINNAEIRLTRVSSNIKNTMKVVGRDFWLCDPYPKIQGINYESFDSFIRTQIFPEIDAAEMRDNELFHYNDTGSCSDFEKKDKIIDLCETEFCAKDNVNGKCEGFMRKCYLHEKGSEMHVCLANPKKYSGKRKYMSVKIGNEVYGNSNECHKNVTLKKFDFLQELENNLWKRKNEPLEKFFGESSFLDKLRNFPAAVDSLMRPLPNLADIAVSAPLYKKENCICTCDEVKNFNQVRYFSLKHEVSDIHLNKVITGARLVKNQYLIQLQIQQATLLKNGNLRKDVEWKSSYNPLGKYPVHKLTWDSRQVNIDHSINAPNTSALTGLRFEVEDDHVKLAIQYTPFDFKSGELILQESKWFSKPSNLKDSDNSSKRKELKFNTALPTGSDHTLDSTDNAFIKFATSSFEDDVGQTVVPFLDTQELTSYPATLLSGAGLVYRSSPISAGFLTLKLQTYDFEPHLLAEDA